MPQLLVDPVETVQRQAVRREVLSTVMRNMCALSRSGAIPYKPGSSACSFQRDVLGDPEVDSWNAMSAALSLANEWLENNAVVDMNDDRLLAALDSIMACSVRVACDEGVPDLLYNGVRISLELQILGALLGETRFAWAQKVADQGNANELQAALDSEAIAFAVTANLHSALIDNAKSRAEEVLWQIHSAEETKQHLDRRDLFLSLRCLFTFYFASLFCNVALVRTPERHAVALAVAVLACGGIVSVLHMQNGRTLQDATDVLHAALFSETALPRPDIFRVGHLICANKDWATRTRVGEALSKMNELVQRKSKAD